MVGFLSAVVSVLTSLKSLGMAGRIGYIFGLSIWTFLCLPTTPIELASGFIFPLWASTFMSVAGKTAGSILALLLGRRLLKPMVVRMLEKVQGGGAGALHKHLVNELRKRPIQTMSILRAAPLPTPFKIYGLCLFQPELVPVGTYFFVALGINTCWSLVWSLTGSSASSLQDAVSGKGNTSIAANAAKLFTVAALLGTFGAFGRFAKERMQPPEDDASLTTSPALAVMSAKSAAPVAAKGEAAAVADDAPAAGARGRGKRAAAAAAAAEDAPSRPRRARSKVRA